MKTRIGRNRRSEHPCALAVAVGAVLGDWAKYRLSRPGSAIPWRVRRRDTVLPRVTQVDRERNRRLFGAFLGWLLYPGRRPGLIGAAIGFAGTVRARGEATLVPEGDDWELTELGQASVSLTTADVLKLVGSGGWLPRTVDVVPDLADLLFKKAIAEVEASIGHLYRAQTEIEKLESSSGDGGAPPVPWIIAEAQLDRALQASITAIVLAIAAAEAQLNTWAEDRGGWAGAEDEDEGNVVEKCRTLALRAGVSIAIGHPPYQELGRAVKRRNSFVHPTPIPVTLPTFGARAPSPGSSTSIEARAACLAVRTSLVDLARVLSVDPPRYLAYCPLVAPDDTQAWHGASLMTGARQDPDFPTVAEGMATRQAGSPATADPSTDAAAGGPAEEV
jgi:hypothetical protein